MKSTQTKRLVLCGVCAALTCVLAPIALPIPVSQVPISLATFAVMLSAALLGPKLGLASQVVYLLLGCIGVPVFAGFSGGPGALVGPTGGYLVGYLALALIEGGIYFALGGKGKFLKKTGVLILAMVLGTVALYALGTAWFMAATHTPLAGALIACVVPFLPGDAAKILVVALAVPQLERALGRFGMLPKAVASLG